MSDLSNDWWDFSAINQFLEGSFDIPFRGIYQINTTITDSLVNWADLADWDILYLRERLLKQKEEM